MCRVCVRRLSDEFRVCRMCVGCVGCETGVSDAYRESVSHVSRVCRSYIECVSCVCRACVKCGSEAPDYWSCCAAAAKPSSRRGLVLRYHRLCNDKETKNSLSSSHYWALYNI